jgi:hypothetical protein
LVDVEGESLHQRIERVGQLPFAEACRIGREVAEGLAAAHQQGVIHRDIKPGNIWLEGPEGTVKILDFGLARDGRDRSPITQAGYVLGTPDYMAPEQAAGQPVDERCDLFSLGCVLYELASGERAFRGENTFAILTALAVSEPRHLSSVNPELPEAFSNLVMALLSKKPEQRPRSARAVAEALTTVQQRTVVQATPKAPPGDSDRQPSIQREEDTTERCRALSALPEEAAPRNSTPARPQTLAAGPRRWPTVVLVCGLALLLLAGVWILATQLGWGTPTSGTGGPSKDLAPTGETGANLKPIPADNVDDPGRWASAINLLPLIDPAKDWIGGDWTVDAAGALSSGNTPAGIYIPYRPGEEYDFRVRFTRLEGNDGMFQYLVRPDDTPESVVAGDDNTIVGFQWVDGRLAGNNQTTVIRPAWLQNGRRYVSTVQVRRDSVRIFLAGELITQWKKGEGQLERLPGSPKREPQLGLGTWNSRMVFHNIEVLEVTGRGTFTRPDDAAAQAAQKKRAASENVKEPAR